MIYPKGAYILHMLRMMMYDQRHDGDSRFKTMMKDFVKTHYNQDVSTEDFKRVGRKAHDQADGSGRKPADGLVFRPVGLWH